MNLFHTQVFVTIFVGTWPSSIYIYCRFVSVQSCGLDASGVAGVAAHSYLIKRWDGLYRSCAYSLPLARARVHLHPHITLFSFREQV